ncbi:MAG: patatin, partial [Deltaproteobacteria bacterium]
MLVNHYGKKNRGFKRMPFVFCTVIIWLSVLVCPAAASDTILEAMPETMESNRPRIGLVLSGGGARGAAHIGVLKVLEKMRIPIDYIAGTSMGSIVGGLYASGMTPAEIEEVVTSLDWTQAFTDEIPRAERSFRRKSEDKDYLIKSKPGLSDELEIKIPSGLIQGQTIDLILKKLVLSVNQVQNFDNFTIPFRAVATDIVTGKAVVLKSGDLAMAMRASMSIPTVLSTVEVDGNLLVDGGVSNNLPIDVARKMGADIVIAIDISTPLAKRKDLNSTLDIAEQLTGILTRSNTEAQIATLSEKDVFIVPDLGDITTSSFDRAGEAIPMGVAAAEEKIQSLEKLSLSKESYTAYRSSRQVHLPEKQSTAPVIDFVRIDNQSRLSDSMISARLKIQEGAPLDLTELEKNIGTLYGLELFENILYDIIQEEGQTGLVVHVKERSWGPNYLQLGFSIGGNQDGDNYYDLSLAYTRTAINQLNGEWRSAVQIGNTPLIFTEIYQPLDDNSLYFINPRLLYKKQTIRLYSSTDDALTEYGITEYGADLAAGRELGTWGEARIGLLRLTGDANVNIGPQEQPEYDFNRGELYAKFSVDTFDNFHFPRKGYYGSVTYLRSEENLGADSEFEQIGMEANLAMSWGKNTIRAGARIYSTLDDTAPVQNRFLLGGLFNLSGFNKDELNGQQLGLVRLIYMRRINDFNLLPTYLGVSLESGNVWEKQTDMGFDTAILAGSLFLGIDTFIGPVYI